MSTICGEPSSSEGFWGRRPEVRTERFGRPPIGSTCEIVDGVYTGRSLRAAHGSGKATAVRELAAAEGFDLAESTAYSDSYSDVPFLETVGHPVAANPDRKLRRIAAERGWPVVDFAS